MFEVPDIPSLQNQNCILIDWFTFVAFGETVDSLKSVLGMDSSDIPWLEEQKFRNGYPLQCSFEGITISYGADQDRFYDDPMKVRNDMGICVNLSGSGCRTFESYGHGDWLKLFSYILRDTSDLARNDHKFIYYHITRLDLAYDDHTGILDIYRIANDIKDRYYISPSKSSSITWSDDQDQDIQGLTCQVGSNSSEIKIRIYDKAAERGFKDRHWVRAEMQLRRDRATRAVELIFAMQHIGDVYLSILTHYLSIRVPSEDTNKSRWPVAYYWSAFLKDIEGISLWVNPGREYNFSRTEYHLVKQYGYAITTLATGLGSDYLIDRCLKTHPVSDLPDKYKQFLFDLNKEDLI